MLNRGRLAGAGAQYSKNDYLTGLWGSVAEYNQLAGQPGAAAADKAKLLVRVVQIAGWYLTSKPPQARTKNRARWDAIRDLVEQAGGEAATLGVKLLGGPSDFQTISGTRHSYWLEFLDPQHRVGYQLAPLFEAWLADPDCIKDKTSFWEKIGVDDAVMRGEAKSDVRYYDEAKRVKFLTSWDAHRLVDNDGDRLSTEYLETHFSDDGWGIWVCSPTNDLYIGSHVVGKKHHSSFLSGAPVKAAGEIIVDGGLVQVITAKSGHYRPTPENMRTFVQAFPQIPRGAAIRPRLSNQNYYTVGNFRAQGEAAPTLNRTEVYRRVPPWARCIKARAELDKIPA